MIHDMMSSVNRISEENKHHAKVFNSLKLIYCAKKNAPKMFFKTSVIDDIDDNQYYF